MGDINFIEKPKTIIDQEDSPSCSETIPEGLPLIDRYAVSASSPKEPIQTNYLDNIDTTSPSYSSASQDESDNDDVIFVSATSPRYSPRYQDDSDEDDVIFVSATSPIYAPTETGDRDNSENEDTAPRTYAILTPQEENIRQFLKRSVERYRREIRSKTFNQETDCPPSN